MSQIQQLFKQLASSLQSGNLASAQKAYGSLEQLLQGNPSRSQASSAQPGSTTSSAVQKDFAALGQALSSGDLSTAQSAFTQLQTDLQAASKSGGASSAQGLAAAHRGHRHEEAAASTGTTANQSSSTSSTFKHLRVKKFRRQISVKDYNWKTDKQSRGGQL